MRLVDTDDRIARPRAADLLRRIDEAGGEPGVARRDAGGRGDRGRHEREAEPHTEDEHRREHMARVVTVTRHARKEHIAARGDQQARDEDGFGREAVDERRGQHRGEDERQAQRQVGDAGLECVVAQHLL
jgi:hypothetical protein